MSRIKKYGKRTKRPVDKRAVGQRPGDGKACLFDAPRTRRRDCVWMISTVIKLILIKNYYTSILQDRNAMNAYTSNYSYAINGDIRFMSNSLEPAQHFFLLFLITQI